MLICAQNIHIYTAPSKKKGCTLAFFKRMPFALITEDICYGIVSTTLCNVTRYISIQSSINFWLRFCIDDRRVKPFLQSFPLTPNTFNGIKSGLNVVVNSCVKMTPSAPWHSYVLMLHSFTTRRILALLSWNMPEPSGKNKSIDGKTWSFSTFRNSADLLCLDLTNWSNPRL